MFSSDQKGLKSIFPNLNMRCSGCAALDLAYVASGRLDGFFFNNINLWDIAAGILIVKEAGGSINDISVIKKIALTLEQQAQIFIQK